MDAGGYQKFPGTAAGSCGGMVSTDTAVRSIPAAFFRLRATVLKLHNIGKAR